MGLDESPETLVTDLGVGKQQLVEIAKALSKDVKLLILDEPTASLNESDSDALLELLRELKGHGIACILISHKLDEIAKVADSITVLRDGATVRRSTREDPVIEDLIIQNMVGREMTDALTRPHPEPSARRCWSCGTGRSSIPTHPDRKVVKRRRRVAAAARSSASPA